MRLMRYCLLSGATARPTTSENHTMPFQEPMLNLCEIAFSTNPNWRAYHRWRSPHFCRKGVGVYLAMKLHAASLTCTLPAQLRGWRVGGRVVAVMAVIGARRACARSDDHLSYMIIYQSWPCLMHVHPSYMLMHHIGGFVIFEHLSLMAKVHIRSFLICDYHTCWFVMYVKWAHVYWSYIEHVAYIIICHRW